MKTEVPRAFISYAHTDTEIARRLAGDLISNGVDVFADFWDLQPGDSIVDKIFEQGIGNAEFVLILLSPASVASRWVKQELDTGLVRRITGQTRLIPVIVEQAEVPVSLRSLKWVDLTVGFDEGVRELVKVIHGVSEKPVVGSRPSFVDALQNSVGGLSQEASALGVALLQTPDEEKGFERAYSGPQLHALVPFLSQQEFNDAVEELESYGLVEAVRVFGTQPYTFGRLSPTYALFIHFQDNSQLGYDPMNDLRVVAVAVTGSGKGTVDRHELKERTGLSPLRLNRAVAYLDAYQIVYVVKTLGTAPFAFNSVAATRRTREFVKQNCV